MGLVFDGKAVDGGFVAYMGRVVPEPLFETRGIFFCGTCAGVLRKTDAGWATDLELDGHQYFSSFKD